MEEGQGLIIAAVMSPKGFESSGIAWSLIEFPTVVPDSRRQGLWRYDENKGYATCGVSRTANRRMSDFWKRDVSVLNWQRFRGKL